MNYKKPKTNILKFREQIIIASLVLFELLVLAFLVFPFSSSPFVSAGIGENVTVTTLLEIGNVFPEILNIEINSGQSIDLNPNSTTAVNVVVTARDFNGEADITNVTAEFFDNSASFYGDIDDNNNHYGNSSCSIDTGYGDIYEIQANCTFDLWYYANNATWNASVRITDQTNLIDESSATETVNTLLAVGLPESIDYGTVNATYVSEERIANVTNFGNVPINLTLSGYAVTEGDGWAMNCSLGAIGNISIDYQKYNLTDTTPGDLDLSTFEGFYTNLTSSPVIKTFNLDYRQNDSAPYLDDTNSTFWRIYVPIGVAGSCQGNIVFGAVRAPES